MKELENSGYAEGVTLTAGLSANDAVQLPTLEVGPYDPCSDTICIEGVTYSGEIFRELGFRTMIGHVLRVESRNYRGVITVTRLREYEAHNAE